MTSQAQLDTLKSMVPAAQASMREAGVPASVTLAQWIFESTWGTSQLALKANNFFGIKTSHLADPNSYIEMPTHEYVGGKLVLVEADFAKYPNAEASFHAHAVLLATAPRYRPAMLSGALPFAFAVRLEQCGYSTNQNYATELMKAMRDYNLTQYDIAPPAQPVALEAA